MDVYAGRVWYLTWINRNFSRIQNLSHPVPVGRAPVRSRGWFHCLIMGHTCWIMLTKHHIKPNLAPPWSYWFCWHERGHDWKILVTSDCIHVLSFCCVMLLEVVLLFACPVRSLLGLFLPAAAALDNDLLCYICFCRKSAQLFHDGRNVIQLRGKAVLALSQILFPLLPLLCCSGATPCFHIHVYASGPASHSFHPRQGSSFAHISQHQ